MTISDLSTPIWIQVVILAIAVGAGFTWFWLFFPVHVGQRLDHLIELQERTVSNLVEINARLFNKQAIDRSHPQSPQLQSDEESTSATCQCFHCGTSITFEKAVYDPDNAIVDCPSCGYRTKIFIPMPGLATPRI
jgi:hypothetical protein